MHLININIMKTPISLLNIFLRKVSFLIPKNRFKVESSKLTWQSVKSKSF